MCSAAVPAAVRREPALSEVEGLARRRARDEFANAGKMPALLSLRRVARSGAPFNRALRD